MDKPVTVAVDPVKERLKAIRAKLKWTGAAGKLTTQEVEDTLADIVDHLGIN